MSSFVRSPLDFLPETGKENYAYFQTKIAEKTLKVDQGHWQWHSSIGHVSFLSSGQ